MIRPLTISAVCVIALAASALEVYQDKTFYTYTPAQRFIGIASVSEAVCNGTEVTVHKQLECPEKHGICLRYNRLRKLYTSRASVQNRLQILERFEQALKLTTVDPKQWIKAASRLAEEKTRRQERLRRLTFDIERTEAALARQTSAKLPVAFESACKGTARLGLANGAVRFEPRYRADLLDNGKMRITQQLEVTNSSGIDFDVEKARFFYYRASQYIRLPHFTPQLVTDEPPYRRDKSTMKARASVAPAPVLADLRTPALSKEKSRTYTITPLKLVSDGIAKRFDLQHYDTRAECGIELTAFARSKAFRVCRFTPKEEIDNHSWEVYEHGKLLNDKASGRYENDRYALYIDHVTFLDVTRRRYVPKKREDGFFETTVRKKDGHILTLTNTSSAAVTVHVIERIPVSTTEKIVVKFPEPKGVTNLQKDKRGKVTFDVTLAAKESKTVPVLYEIVHDKATRAYIK